MAERSFNEQFLEQLEGLGKQRILRPGIDFVDDVLWYGVEIGGKTYFLKTGGQILELKALPIGYAVDEGAVHGMPLSADGIKRYLRGESVDGARLIADLTAYFSRHAKFEPDTLPAVLAHWVLAGYAHMAFPVFPYLSLTSAQRGCGKSRVLELLAEVGFRAKPLMVTPTAAVLFRSLHASGQVMLIDEFENATDDTQKALVSVLNSGFQRGAQVPRCVGDEYNVKHFQTYSPKAFAGLSHMPEALQNRSIPILMSPKTHADKIEPFSPIIYEDRTSRWRDDAAIWALCNAPQLAAAVSARGELGVSAFLEDREADYMATLFATAKVAGSDLNALRSYCQSLAETRQSRAGEGQAVRAVQALATWLPIEQGESKLLVADAAKLFYECEAIPEQNHRDAGALLRKMGLQVVQIRKGEITGKGIILMTCPR